MSAFASESAAAQRPARWMQQRRTPRASSAAIALLLACGCAPHAKSPSASSAASSLAPAASSTARAPLEPRVPTPAPSFVWADASGEGRAQVVWFRRDLELGAPPREAALHLFASSRYLLFVNGAAVASGPARSYPERPAFDSVDLRPHLVPGRNT